MIQKIRNCYDTSTTPQIECPCILGYLSLSQALLTSVQKLKNIPKNESLEDDKKFNNWKPCPKP